MCLCVKQKQVKTSHEQMDNDDHEDDHNDSIEDHQFPKTFCQL